MSLVPGSTAGAAPSAGGMAAGALRWWRRCSLLQRVLFSIALAAPLVWLLAASLSYRHARHEVHELFDTQMIRLARQIQATLPSAALEDRAAPDARPPGDMGEADLEDMAIAVWDREGRLLLVDREGAQLPNRGDASGFVDLRLGDAGWRAYYLPALDGRWLIAVGQTHNERDEIVEGLVLSQLVPWLLMLPLLLVAMAWAVRQALRPLGELGVEVARRRVDDLEPLPVEQLPRDLQPLAISMNALFLRVDAAIERERRFTGDAAHELRTPLAALRAQWDALRLQHAASGSDDRAANAKMDAGFERLQRLLGQLLELARIDHRSTLVDPRPLDWSALVPSVLDELLPLATRRQVELAVEWPADAPSAALPLAGDGGLMSVLLRNLLDNALNASPPGATVTLLFAADAVEVLDAGPGIDAAALPHLGERFFRAPGSAPGGSGLGLSIATRIAALHGLVLDFELRTPGPGLRARLRRAA
ncbi:ATP-binding protein [Rivibacter subsaxonicus]|uniref:histidine kinase n=1 Tax=Rivibacter subsaxonicus TaxID=457575 RepID=A0A4Q7W054_9BURK|nr:ATP-binding protein [Rivibacter subsaxonicus]RZU02527.1 signal transduction histidine kinase [Rivibacter subsaxonicus]